VLSFAWESIADRKPTVRRAQLCRGLGRADGVERMKASVLPAAPVVKTYRKTVTVADRAQARAGSDAVFSNDTEIAQIGTNGQLPTDSWNRLAPRSSLEPCGSMRTPPFLKRRVGRLPRRRRRLFGSSKASRAARTSESPDFSEEANVLQSLELGEHQRLGCRLLASKISRELDSQ
jgi:hypothetical protein